MLMSAHNDQGYVSCHSECVFASDSSTVMDTQHIQGEGVPPQAGEGQRHHRPDQRYLSLHPITVSFCLFQKTTQQEAGKPWQSGWPAHRLGFHIKGDDLKKTNKKEIPEGFCGEMHTCAFWTKDSCWLKQGGGGHGVDWICPLPVSPGDSRRKGLPAPRFNAPTPPLTPHTPRHRRAEVTRWHADVSIPPDWLTNLKRGRAERNETRTARERVRGWVGY